jgi:hypothetical protein
MGWPVRGGEGPGSRCGDQDADLFGRAPRKPHHHGNRKPKQPDLVHAAYPPIFIKAILTVPPTSFSACGAPG